MYNNRSASVSCNWDRCRKEALIGIEGTKRPMTSKVRAVGEKNNTSLASSEDF